ncbi:hypothetical protein [Nonomuraea turcica]|uniref:hypothetical protein n=1 Tax=Nonomuraea sp. G32 TaxID=3067274 RepID=UPI00273A9E60|nr:hypothetical protein [Nonomuraea sp. G32]MDP4509982.1 hypothetical protein [Nonomuraea sp. G32]
MRAQRTAGGQVADHAVGEQRVGQLVVHGVRVEEEVGALSPGHRLVVADGEVHVGVLLEVTPAPPWANWPPSWA